MPIKFRCEHCQQLLGISRSRAAATVDCPQCGRSLKVPGAASDQSSDDVSSPQSENSATADSDLMSALNELTMLGQFDDGLEVTSVSSELTGRAFDDSSTVIVGKDVPEERSGRRNSVSGREPQSRDETKVVENHDVPAMSSMDALQDLASWSKSESVVSATSQTPQIATDLLGEMRQASHPSSWLANSIAALLLVAISGAAGWWLAKSEQLEAWLDQDGNQSQPVGQSEEQQQVVAASHIPAAIRVDPSEWVISVEGQVRYLDESGQDLPDGSASIYLLPASREGNLKVHARSFQREPSNADRKFSEAALQALGGLRVEADEEGRFQVGTRTQSDGYQLVVVSRHRERPQNMLPESSITNALMPWFDSTVHILGQRETVMQMLSESSNDLIVTVGK